MSLYLFDIDGTVIRSFLREGAPRTPENYAEVVPLPRRREKLDALRAAGHAVAFVTNQGGVAFGYQTLDEVVKKLDDVGFRFGFEETTICTDRHDPRAGGSTVYCSLGHPKAKVAEYLVEEGDRWRKPGGWMLVQAMLDYNVPSQAVTFVGDMDSDREAAQDADVTYIDAEEFFQ